MASFSPDQKGQGELGYFVLVECCWLPLLQLAFERFGWVHQG
jgi:hypothetical protein